MKKILLALGVLVLLSAVGLAIFIATFDANRYRPLLIEQLQKTLGRPVTLGRISVSFRNGIAAQVEGFTVPEAAGEPLIAVDSISAAIRLMPLFRRQVEISSVLLTRPRVLIIRSAQGQINLAGLSAVSSPAATDAGYVSQSSGKPPMSFQIGAVRIVDGTLHWKDRLRQPAAEITISALNVTVKHITLGRPMDVSLDAAVGGSQPNVKLKGRVLAPNGKEAGWVKQGRLEIDRMAIAPLLAAQPGNPNPKAALTAQLQFELPTLNQSELLSAFSAEGTVHLNDFVIENANVLRSVFDRLSILPGLVQRLEADLPPEYLQKLSARDTVFAPVHLPVKLQSGVLMLEGVDLKTDTVRLTGRGQVGILSQAVTLQTVLSVDPMLSAALINRVNELGGLANVSGELEIPVNIQGRAPQLTVLPDLNYVASKVIVRKAIDVIGGLLERKSEGAPDSQAPQSAQPDASQAQPTPEELVGTLLRRALRKQLPSEETAPAQPAQ